MRWRQGGVRHVVSVLLLVVLLPVVSCGQGLPRNAQRTGYSMSDGPLVQTLHLIRDCYVDRLGIDSVEEAALRQLLEQLDPHSYYLTAEEAKDRRNGFEGKFYGVGVAFQLFKDTVRVVQVLPDGPASRAGMLVGDNILEVDGKRLSGVKAKMSDVRHAIRGEKGTFVQVRVQRGRSSLIFRIERSELPLHTVTSYYMLTPTIGYLHCNSFGFSTREEIVEALSELENAGMKSLVFDLCDNDGGIFQTAVAVCSDFLQNQQSIVSAYGANYPSRSFSSSYTGKYSDLPMVVLVNEFSASAAEIVAGAMQDWDRAVLVGTRTFGKGLVQGVFPLSTGGELNLTVARYYTPSGRSIQTPYEMGHRQEYREAFERRIIAGQEDTADDKYFTSPYKYKTRVSGRTVYGGGGVVPDVYIRRDTLGLPSSRLLRYEREGYMLQWVVDHMGEKRQEYMEKYPFVESFMHGFALVQSELRAFRLFVDKLSGRVDTIPFTEAEEARLRLWLKAYIGDQLYGRGVLLRVKNVERAEIACAIRILEDWKGRGESILRSKR